MSKPARVAVLLAALAGCARLRPPTPPAAPAPAPPAPPVVAGDTIRDTTLDNGFLDVRIEIPPRPEGPKPVVLSPLTEQEALLQAGAITVTYKVNWKELEPLAPPAPTQNTVGVWMLASPTPKKVGEGFFKLIEYDAQKAIPLVLDYLADMPEVDTKRIGIAGSSTLGFVALEATAHDKRLAVAAAVFACGDYRTFLHLSDLAMNGKPLDLDADYARGLDERDPALHPERLVHAAVLMTNGAADTSIPLRCAENTAHELERAYRKGGVPNRFRFRVLPGVAHSQNADTRSEVLAWWRRWLLPS